MPGELDGCILAISSPHKSVFFVEAAVLLSGSPSPSADAAVHILVDLSRVEDPLFQIGSFYRMANLKKSRIFANTRNERIVFALAKESRITRIALEQVEPASIDLFLIHQATAHERIVNYGGTVTRIVDSELAAFELDHKHLFILAGLVVDAIQIGSVLTCFNVHVQLLTWSLSPVIDSWFGDAGNRIAMIACPYFSTVNADRSVALTIATSVHRFATVQSYVQSSRTAAALKRLASGILPEGVVQDPDILASMTRKTLGVAQVIDPYLGFLDHESCCGWCDGPTQQQTAVSIKALKSRVCLLKDSHPRTYVWDSKALFAGGFLAGIVRPTRYGSISLADSSGTIELDVIGGVRWSMFFHFFHVRNFMVAFESARVDDVKISKLYLVVRIEDFDILLLSKPRAAAILHPRHSLCVKRVGTVQMSRETGPTLECMASRAESAEPVLVRFSGDAVCRAAHLLPGYFVDHSMATPGAVLELRSALEFMVRENDCTPESHVPLLAGRSSFRGVLLGKELMLDPCDTVVSKAQPVSIKMPIPSRCLLLEIQTDDQSSPVTVAMASGRMYDTSLFADKYVRSQVEVTDAIASTEGTYYIADSWTRIRVVGLISSDCGYSPKAVAPARNQGSETPGQSPQALASLAIETPMASVPFCYLSDLLYAIHVSAAELPLQFRVYARITHVFELSLPRLDQDAEEDGESGARLAFQISDSTHEACVLTEDPATIRSLLGFASIRHLHSQDGLKTVEDCLAQKPWNLVCSPVQRPPADPIPVDMAKLPCKSFTTQRVTYKTASWPRIYLKLGSVMPIDTVGQICDLLASLETM